MRIPMSARKNGRRRGRFRIGRFKFVRISEAFSLLRSITRRPARPPIRHLPSLTPRLAFSKTNLFPRRRIYLQSAFLKLLCCFSRSLAGWLAGWLASSAARSHLSKPQRRRRNQEGRRPKIVNGASSVVLFEQARLPFGENSRNSTEINHCFALLISPSSRSPFILRLCSLRFPPISFRDRISKREICIAKACSKIR